MKRFVEDYSDFFGHGADALDRARMSRDSTAPKSGLRSTVWQQQHEQIDIFEAIFISHVTAKGELVNLTAQFLSDPAAAAVQGASSRPAGQPTISPEHALRLAAQNLQVPGAETAEIAAQAPATGPELRQKLRSPILEATPPPTSPGCP